MTSEPLAELGRDSLVGAYRIVREIGRGGMATVYEAGHTVLPRRAALKVMHGDLRRQPGMATRVVQEAAILDAVRHPGVVRVYDCAVLPDRRPWIAMELVEGDTLANRIHEATALPPVEVATLLGDVADVLAAVHKAGVVHRDLKPDNLLCTPTDYDFPIRVLDWGVARMGPIGRLTINGLTPGTPIYMSPEQATGRDIGPPCDIYSLGVIAYEALAGHPPFDGRTLAEVVCMHLTREPLPLRLCCNAPIEMSALISRMLHKRPEARPTAVEVRHAARGIARELSQAYESFELSFLEADAAAARRPASAYTAPSDEVEVIDAEALEYGVTEMIPVVPRPRWTPDFARVPSMIAEQPRPATIAPRAQRDQVAGEIDVTADVTDESQ
ncbi:MAG: serine/threonine protein kinase [Deltaproteobacteria bacterium]|nr:MAG: serine/threonine protein kinase [Deltaproteobacteria bacterium]